jgi:pimeloyl-ACP methyl ester carboxylesterase
MLAYDVTGRGPALVLLHAGIAHRGMWDDQVPVFAEHFTVIRPDLRGFGETGPAAGEFSHVDDLAALLAHLGVSQAALLGCSKGGTLALDYALAHPGQVRALVLVGATPSGYQFTGSEPAQWAEVVASFKAGDLERTAELETQIWVDGPSRTPDQVDPSVRARVRAMDLLALQHEVAAGEVSERRPNPPAISRLGTLAVPALALVGDLDQPDVVAASEYLAANIAGAQHAVIAGTAHVPNMEKPVEFNRLVLDFLLSVE